MLQRKIVAPVHTHTRALAGWLLGTPPCTPVHPQALHAVLVCYVTDRRESCNSTHTYSVCLSVLHGTCHRTVTSLRPLDGVLTLPLRYVSQDLCMEREGAGFNEGRDLASDDDVSAAHEEMTTDGIDDDLYADVCGLHVTCTSSLS